MSVACSSTELQSVTPINQPTNQLNSKVRATSGIAGAGAGLELSNSNKLISTLVRERLGVVSVPGFEYY